MELLPLVCLCLLSCSGDAVRVVVEEDSDAVLPCSFTTVGSLAGKRFDWRKEGQKEVFLYDAGIHSNNGRPGQDEQFKGRVSHFKDQLRNGNASIEIRNTKMADSGNYSCDFPRLQPRQTFYIELVVAVRVVVEEGSDAVLPCSPSTREDISGKVFDWKKDGQKVVFMYEAGIHYNNGLPGQDEQFKGRVSFFQDELRNGDASIKITKTKMADSGIYSCSVSGLQPRQTFNIELVVDPRVKVVVEEGSDAVLPCLISTKEDISGKVFDWKKDGQKDVFLYDGGKKDANRGQDEQFKGRVSFFQDQLRNGNASIKITNTKMADSGIYSCIFPRLQPRQTFDIELVVDRVLKDRTCENIPGAAPRPFVKTLAQTKDGILLQCEAHGDPPPTVEWKDGDGNTLPAEKPQISEREGRSYITVKITLTKISSYSCVATQETHSHQIAAATYILVYGSNTTLVIALVVVSLLLVVVAVPAGLYLKNRITQNPTTDKKKSDGEEVEEATKLAEFNNRTTDTI